MNNKIAMFVPSLHGGGAERVMATLAKEFCDQGIEVDMVLAKAEGTYLAELSSKVKVVDLGVSRIMFSLFALIRYLRRERPKVLLSTLYHANIIAILAAKISLVKTKVVVREAVNFSVDSNAQHGFVDRVLPFLVRILYPFADKVIAVSGGVATDLVKVVGLQQSHVKVIYNPLDLNGVLEKADAQVEQPWQIKGDIPLILGVGRLSRQKDFETLIKAFAEVKRSNPSSKARLLILGEGELRSELEQLVAKFGLENDVLMPGFVENPYAIIKNASVFVLSSRWEGLPNVLIQALAIGVPVVSTSCPSGPEEILENGVWGRLVPVGEPLVMAEAITAVLQEGKRTDKSDVIKYCERKFSLKNVAADYLEALFM